MANSGRTCPINPGPGYAADVTTSAPEPTNADLLAFMQTAFAHLSTEIAGVKTDVGEVKADLAGTEDRLRGEIRATEATLGARIEAVQQVVRSVKADLAAHVNDPDAHRPHAA